MFNEANLAQFSGGTENWYAHWTKRLVYTDGVKYLADEAGAHWLVDAIASYQGTKELKGEEFQLWELNVDLEKKTCVLTCRSDSGEPALVTQNIEYTDFPLAYFKLYCEQGEAMTLMLPGER